MAGLDDATVLLRGGSRDGETTTVPPEVTRLLAASDAPGLIDVYEATAESAHVAGNDLPAQVYVFVDQEPIGELAPEMLHMPPKR